MKPLKIFAAVICMLYPAVCCAAPEDQLQGTWIETDAICIESQRASLTFQDHKVSIKKLYGVTAAVKYWIEEYESDDSFTLSFEFTRRELGEHGQRISRQEVHTLKYHKENGMPVLSQIVYIIEDNPPFILNEYLRQKDFKEEHKAKFSSELKETMNLKASPQICTEAE